MPLASPDTLGVGDAGRSMIEGAFAGPETCDHSYDMTKTLSVLPSPCRVAEEPTTL